MECVNIRNDWNVLMSEKNGMCEFKKKMECFNVRTGWKVWMLRIDGMCEC